jgi:hypothetical protein
MMDFHPMAIDLLSRGWQRPAFRPHFPPPAISARDKP